MLKNSPVLLNQHHCGGRPKSTELKGAPLASRFLPLGLADKLARRAAAPLLHGTTRCLSRFVLLRTSRLSIA